MKWRFMLVFALAAVCSALVFVRPADASVADLAETTSAAAREAGDAFFGELPSFWQASAAVGRREAMRRLAALGFPGMEDVSLSAMLRPVSSGEFAAAASRAAGWRDADETAALTRWRSFGFALDGENVKGGEAAAVILRILGYPMPDSEVGRAAAALAVRETLGITDFPGDTALTKGDAALLFFHLLDTTDADGVCPADRLAEQYILLVSDVSTLLRAGDQYAVDTYLWARGYEVEGPDEGYYGVALTAAPEWQFNALMSKENSDVDGLAVTLWGATTDSSQTFRFEKTEKGTYLVYCAASKGGYNRVLGLHKSKQHLALYKPSSSHAMEFLLRTAGPGEWYFLSADDPTLCLTVDGEPGKNVKIVLRELGSQPEGQVFSLIRRGAIDGDGAEAAIFPAMTLRITQGAFDVYSHGKQNAIDITIPGKRAYAPFTAEVVRIDKSYDACNAVWIQSCEPVRYADGTLDYMTAVFMHDNSVRDLSVGQVLLQGQYFYDMGTAGNAAGAHIHIAVLRGAFTKQMKLTGSGDVFAEEAFFLLSGTDVENDYGLAFRYFAADEMA